MSRNITWINEIHNNTKDNYVIWVWDTDNEGAYTNQKTGKRVVNDGGKQVVLEAGTTYSVTGCGVPDGGDKNGVQKARVVCKQSLAKSFRNHDPGYGLRLNRVMDQGERDKLVYRDHKTGREVASVAFPRGMEQNVIMRIENDGIYLDLREQMISSEWKAYKFGVAFAEGLAQALKEVAKIALEAAAGALMAV